MALAGLAVAYAAFALTFRGPRARFWQRMTMTGAALGSIALAGDADLRRPRLGRRDTGVGLAIAAGLYAVFQVGDRAARRLLPGGEAEIGDIYALRALRPRPEIALRLAAVIGPAEELFWRGLLQRALCARVGPAWATACAAAAYGGAHLVTGNVALIGAAATAGLYWSVLAALGAPMTALVVSHVVWDVWIFLVAPTQGERPSPAPMSETPAPTDARGRGA
ncbi:MAG: CPBP family intramembrane metalloprotease [Chloroflexota bacterium]|nr:CPBP family intramembrane metalloprotease [Chloroflexota bacterium]